MKKFVTPLIIILLTASIAMAAVYLRTAKKAGEDDMSQTTWANVKASPDGIMNTTGATKALKTLTTCTQGMVEFGTVSGTNIMNIAMQTAMAYDPEKTGALPSVFYNSIGSTSAPYHQVDPADTDTHKFDFNSRAFDYWRLNCLVGCDLTNSIATAHGDCWREGR
jgi:hypothetical protein